MGHCKKFEIKKVEQDKPGRSKSGWVKPDWFTLTVSALAIVLSVIAICR